jgi:hypothetical protein
MSQEEKIWEKLMSGKSDQNISFAELRNLLIKLDFIERIKGSHHIYEKENIPELINLQKDTSGKAKDYQVKQLRKFFIKYEITIK